MATREAMCKCCKAVFSEGQGRYNCPREGQVCLGCVERGCPGCPNRCLMRGMVETYALRVQVQQNMWAPPSVWPLARYH